MTNEELLKKIQKAKASGATELDLSGNQLTELPSELFQVTSLTKLNLNGNHLTSLPNDIKSLTKLSVLTLRSNQLTKVPSEIFQLLNLTDLCLNDNHINTLSLEISLLANLTELDLSGNQLKQLPPEIGKLTSLVKLELWNNQIAKLPIEIFHLKKLEKLTLNENPLAQLPPEIELLANLKELYIGKCQLTHLPLELFKLTKLERLGLWENQLQEVPVELSCLSKLIYLDLSRNQLKKVPTGIFNLKGLTALHLTNNRFVSLPNELFQLTNLTWLNLNSNQLTKLPQEIGLLTNLKELHLHKNQIIRLPAKIGQLIQLELLDLGGNRLTKLPITIGQLAKLTQLYLWENPLNRLPSTICQLAKLTTLNLWGTPITFPPLEIAEKGIEAIRQYFISLDKGERPLNEVKIILVGEGAAGKTSLVKQLLGQPIDGGEKTTPGINIQDWEPYCDGKQIRVNIWDFGGQEIQHATHQFFLSKRSLYVLVLNSRKDERTEYWLRHIEAFGGDSPVLVVLNKQDENPAFDVNRAFLQKKYPSIREFFSTSCKTGKGIADFRKALLTELTTMPMLKTIWPANWFVVKRKLEDMDNSYISANEYRKICKEAGITDKQPCETLIDFLHDLGVAVHFRDFILDAMHVLDPLWVTTAVYKIITAEKMVDSTGFLRLKHLGEILPQDDSENFSCPPETYPFIMRLMQKFELCYPVGEEAVLIPQLLSVSEPEFNFKQDGSLRFALSYPDFLPPSVFPRFMVKVYRDIEDGFRWRTGVVLNDKIRNAQALVKADVEARSISIWVQGERRREYLNYLRYQLADINSSFEKLKVMELVPMPDNQDITADYVTLLECAKNDIDKYIPTGATKVYSIIELLGLVQPKDAGELINLLKMIGIELNDEVSMPDTLSSGVNKKIGVREAIEQTRLNDKEQLAELLKKIIKKPDERRSLIDMIIDCVVIIHVPPFISFNLTCLFKNIWAYYRQRHQQSTR